MAGGARFDPTNNNARDKCKPARIPLHFEQRCSRWHITGKLPIAPDSDAVYNFMRGPVTSSGVGSGCMPSCQARAACRRCSWADLNVHGRAGHAVAAFCALPVVDPGRALLVRCRSRCDSGPRAAASGAALVPSSGSDSESGSGYRCPRSTVQGGGLLALAASQLRRQRARRGPAAPGPPVGTDWGPRRPSRRRPRPSRSDAPPARSPNLPVTPKVTRT